MSDAVLQGSLSDDNERVTPPALKEESSGFYEKLDPVLQLFSDLAERRHDSENFLDRLLEQITKEVNPDLLLFFKWDEGNQEWFLHFQNGLPQHMISEGKLARAWQSLPTIVSHEAEPLYSDDISKDRRFIGQVIRGINIRTFHGITLRSEKTIYGSLLTGFFEPSAMSSTDQRAFLMMSNLLRPYLVPNAPDPSPIVAPQFEEKKESSTEGITLSLDLSGRIKACSPLFLDCIGLNVDGVQNTALSTYLTKKSYTSYLSAVKKLKASDEGIESILLEALKPGGRKRILSAQLSLEKQEEKLTAITLSAKDVTQIDPLETEIIYKNALYAIWSSISSALQKISHETSGRAKHQLDEAKILKEALKKGFLKLGLEGACLLRLQASKKKLLVIAEQGLSERQQEQIEKHGLGAKEHLLWNVIEKGDGVYIGAKSKKSSIKKRLFGEDALSSFMGVPIESEDHLWGELILFSREEILPEIDLKALKVLGHEVGRVIDQVKAFDLLQKRIESLETLNEVGLSITKNLNLEQLLNSIAENLKKMIGASNSYIFLEDAKRHVYYGASGSDQRGDAVRKFEIKVNENHLIPITARERHPFVIENASSDPRVGKKWIKAFKSRSLLAVPFINRDRVTGVLLLDETRYFRKFTNEEIQNVSVMANQVSIGIENAILHHSVSRHRERLQTLSSTIVNVQEEERRRIAKKLRDESGADLTAIRDDIEWLKKTVKEPSSEMKKRFDRVGNKASKTFDRLKALSAELRPAILDESGLVSTIKWVVKEFETQTKTKVQLQIGGTIKRLPARIEILLFRIIQESLANISTHAKAESAIVSLEKREPHIHLYITDDGKGFDVKRYFSSPQMMRKEIGILGMKERVELSGGTFYIDSQPGKGTRISIRIPVVRRNPQSSN